MYLNSPESLLPYAINNHIFTHFLSAWQTCLSVTFQAFYYPNKAGFPIGTDDSPRNYMLEIHYNNPKGVEGQGFFKILLYLFIYLFVYLFIYLNKK